MRTDSVFRGATRVATVTALAAVLLVVAATPAGAHGVGGIRASNYETRVLSVRPTVAGVSIRSVDLGSRLELHNHSGRTVIVEGYDGEPYLRVGATGVFENTRSPATYLNRDRFGEGTPVPDSADPDAPPRWRMLSSGHNVRWHDHRAHWMGRTEPPAVRRAPDETHLIERFDIPAAIGDEVFTIRGDVRWVPGPSPWPLLVGAIALAAVVIVAARRRQWGVALGIGLGVLIVTEAVHVGGLFGATTSSAGTTIVASVFSLVGIGLGLVALTTIRRRDAATAIPLVMFAAIFLIFAGGVADITALWRSQIPTTLPSGVARATVAVVVGVGIGVLVGAATHLRTPNRDARRTSIRR
jgi:hypothetical protein